MVISLKVPGIYFVWDRCGGKKRESGKMFSRWRSRKCYKRRRCSWQVPLLITLSSLTMLYIFAFKNPPFFISSSRLLWFWPPLITTLSLLTYANIASEEITTLRLTLIKKSDKKTKHPFSCKQILMNSCGNETWRRKKPSSLSTLGILVLWASCL